MNSIRALVELPRFRDGFVVGSVLAVVLVGGAWVWHPTHDRSRLPCGLTGPAWVLASLIALGGWIGYHGAGAVPAQLLAGLVVLLIAGEIAERTPNPKIVGFVLALPGAILLGFSVQFPGPSWSKWLVVGMTSIGAPLAADLDRRGAPLGLGPVLWLLAVAGLYWTVPDTERVRPLIGAAVPLGLTGWPIRRSRMGAGGIGAAVGLFIWVAAIEGRGRPGSMVGAVASLGLLVVEPIGRMLVKGRAATLLGSLRPRVVGLCFVGVQLLVVGYASRVAGFAETGGGALMLLVPVAPLAVGLGGFLPVPAGERARRRSGLGDRSLR